MSKRIIFTTFVFALVLSLSLFASAAEITSADDMLTLMNTPSMWADSYTLTTDINLADATNGLSQAPIGNTTTQFTGTFDGDGHTISGINLTGYTTDYVALFGYVSNGTIKNLTVSGTVSTTGNYAAGLIARVYKFGVTVENCINLCDVSGNENVAGIIGRLEPGSYDATISGCKNEGEIVGEYHIGGIIGLSSQSNGRTVVKQCVNEGDVTCTYYSAGGIVGYWRVFSGSTNKCSVEDCMNTAAVYCGTKCVGGIIGQGNAQNYAYTVTRCFNSGSVTCGATSYVQPIAGVISKATYDAGNMVNCYYSSTDSYTSESGCYANLCSTYVADATVASNFAGLGEAWVIADGHTPELEIFHTHGYKYVAVGANHQYICYCGDIAVTEAHTFVDGVCDKCGAEDIPCAHENKYEVVETVATCSSVGSKYEFCPDCKTRVSADVEIPVDSANHSGTLNMALASGNIMYTCSKCNAIAYTDSALLDTVYVSENGKELIGKLASQIGTMANPFKNFTDAMQYAAYCGKDAIVTILDSAEIPAEYITPTFEDTITVKGGTLVTNNRLLLGGDMVFEDICFSNTVALVVAAQENKLVMGEGITSTGADIYLVGGYESGIHSNSDIPATGFATDITLRSGKYHAVGGGNRFLTGAYSGTIKMTIGKTDPSDVLIFDSTLVTGSLNYDGGDGVVATVIFDGDVDNIETYRPVGHAAAGVEGRFDVDIVVKGSAVIGIGTADVRGHDFTLNVYADSRVKGAEEFAANIVGADNVQPYKRYCLKVNGTHPDVTADSICDNCGAPTECEHESGEWRETVKANCISGASYVWYCADCQEIIETMTKTGETLDADNHVSDSYVWQYDGGKYFFGCSTCGAVTEQTSAPTVYVSASGNDSYVGTSVQNAVATVEEAVSRIANVGGTVVICGSYTISGELTLPKYSKPITFSGSDTDDAYFYGGFKISAATVISLGGETKFDSIGFDGNAAYIIECNWNDVTFGKVEAVNNAYAHIVLGSYKITESDNLEANATVTITEGVTITRNVAGDYNKTRFYAYIYLGSTFGADGVSVSSKTATLNATNADIGVLYTMSTSSTYNNSPVNNCETTVNLYGRTLVNQGRTGDYNVAYAESTASLEKMTLNFFDNSYIGTNYYIRNVENTVINVSTEADGRTNTITIPFTFYAYGSFESNSTPMNIEMNYSSHSFATWVAEPIAFQNAADALKVVTENVTDECEYSAKVTVPATPDSEGTKLYSCSCGRSYTEQYAYSCADATHIYLAKTDGSFECTVCGETFDSVSGDNIFAANVASLSDGKLTANVSVKGTFAAAHVNVAVPAGYTFSQALLPESEDFIIMGADNVGVYSFTVLSNDGSAKTADIAFDIVFSGEEEGVVEVTVTELYNADRKSLVATAVSAEIPEIDTVVGDINGDGVLTVFDALMLIKAIVNNENVVNADVNADGKVNLADSIRIFKEIAK